MALSDLVAAEVGRRKSIWAAVQSAETADGIPSGIPKSLGLYRGQAGIYFDSASTRAAHAPRGVAIAFRHNGETYADDLSSTGVIFHYPNTDRAGDHDEGEIESARTAFRLGIPVFVIDGAKSSRWRRIHLGYVEQFNDDARIFLITFVKEPILADLDESADPFSLTQPPSAPILKLVRTRPNQRRFVADVLRRYGSTCAVCSLSTAKLIVAAHLMPKSLSGADDARNGLPLCPNHHAALDKGLWRVGPGTHEIVYNGSTDSGELQITRTNLDHLPHQPHEEAVVWMWDHGFDPVSDWL